MQQAFLSKLYACIFLKMDPVGINCKKELDSGCHVATIHKKESLWKIVPVRYKHALANDRLEFCQYGYPLSLSRWH